MVVEDRALAVAEALDAGGRGLQAARLREVVPESFGLCDEHVPLLRDRLRETVVVAPELAPLAKRILSALDDLPSFIGVRGTVWTTWASGGYDAYWEEEDWLEGAPSGLDLDGVLAWANRRADRVLVMPEWDRRQFYSAGRTRDPEHPQLER
ncbi:MAG: hypothetical protein QOJ11_1704 [Frankiales bacterium]|jgi:hypothetical protein|nr:hypothetical protein [Frankiales bacterium]